MRIVDAYSWKGHLLGNVSVLKHGVIFNLGSAQVCSPAMFEIYFSKTKIYGLLELIIKCTFR